MHSPGAERNRPLITACYPAAALPTSCQQVPLNLSVATDEGDWRREEVKGCLTPFRVVNGIFLGWCCTEICERGRPWQGSR